MILDDFVYTVTVKVLDEKATCIEERIKLILRPKPKWLSTRQWKWILRKLIYIERVKS